MFLLKFVDSFVCLEFLLHMAIDNSFPTRAWSQRLDWLRAGFGQLSCQPKRYRLGVGPGVHMLGTDDWNCYLSQEVPGTSPRQFGSGHQPLTVTMIHQKFDKIDFGFFQLTKISM